MKNVILLLLVLVFTFMSCDGRKSADESIKDSISEFNKKQSSIEVVSYYPKAYTEISTDTLIANSLKVCIKNYSIMNKNVTISQDTENKILNKNYHRVFESEIIVYKESTRIFKTTINANQFEDSKLNPFWNNATLEHTWVNQESSNDDQLDLRLSFINPQTKSFKIYQMTIDSFGKQQFNLLEEHI